MPRKARVEFPGAVYDVIDRGDRREAIFGGDPDRELFLRTLGEACQRTGWRIHAYVLMSNHYHLLLETPEPNLVAGMRWFQSTYAIRFNCRHRLRGHLFQGRYKAVLVDPEDRTYFAILADYIHLNPVRAGLIGPAEELEDYAWSSHPFYVRSVRHRPAWLEVETVFGEFGLRDSACGRREFARRLQGRLQEDRSGQLLKPETVKELRRGWCLGGEAFRDRMLELLESSSGKLGARKPIDGAIRRAHGEQEAERLVRRALTATGLEQSELIRSRKNDPRKILIGALIRQRTLASNAWIARRLSMGDPTRVSRYCGSPAVLAKKSLIRHIRELVMSICKS